MFGSLNELNMSRLNPLDPTILGIHIWKSWIPTNQMYGHTQSNFIPVSSKSNEFDGFQFHQILFCKSNARLDWWKTMEGWGDLHHLIRENLHKSLPTILNAKIRILIGFGTLIITYSQYLILWLYLVMNHDQYNVYRDSFVIYYTYTYSLNYYLYIVPWPPTLLISTPPFPPLAFNGCNNVFYALGLCSS